MAKIKEIDGIGSTFREKLKDAGIATVEVYLEFCSTREGRQQLSESTSISESQILKWANRADLARIKGIGGEYAELLETAGVNTVPELAQRRADHLYEHLNEINEQKKLVRKMPSEQQVEEWIEKAKKLPRVLEY